MAEGFAAGLAGGLAQGAQLADAQAARQLAAERAQAQEQNYQSLAQSRIDAENRQAAADARAAQNARFNDLQKYRTDLLNRASAATDPAIQARYAAQIGQADSQLHDMFAGSPHVANAQASRSNAQANATALANGQKTFADLPPNDVYEMMSHAVGVPADQVLRGPNGEPSAHEQALQDFHAGLANSHLDNGAQALSGLNGAYGHVLHGYLATMLPDGTVVDNAKFASPAALPNGQIVPRVSLSGTTADGRTATAIHPMFAAGATPANGMPVHTTTIPQVLANSNAKQGLIAAANHPYVAAQIKAATNGPQVAQHLDALHVAGVHPTYANPAGALAQQEAQAQAQVDYLNNVIGKPSRVQTIRNQLGDPIGYAAVGADKPAVSVAAFDPNKEALDRSLIHQRNLEAAKKNQATGLGTNLDPAALAGFKNAFLANGITSLSRLPAAERNQIVGGVEQDFRDQNLTEPQITRIFSNIGPRNKEQTALLTGRDGVQLQAINTIIPHLGTLAKLVQARQNNASPQAIRGLEQEFQQQFGQTAPVNVQLSLIHI